MKKEAANEIRTYTIYKIETDVKEITGYADGIWIPCYIGSTCQVLSERMHGHVSHKSAVTPYIKKYGRKHFRIIAMFTVNTTFKIAHKYEGTQIKIGKEIFCLLNEQIGDKQSESMKKHLSNINKQKIPLERREQLNKERLESLARKVITKNVIKKTNETVSIIFGKQFSEEFKNHRKETQKRGGEIVNARKIYCKELDKAYDCIKDAAEDLNIGYSNIRSQLQGISNYCAGYRFCYLEDKDTFDFSVKKQTKKVRCVETQQVFNSIQECANYFHTTHSTISIAVNKPRPYKKFHFEFVKEDE